MSAPNYSAPEGPPRPGGGDDRIVGMFFPLEQQIIAAGSQADALGWAVVDKGRNAFFIDEGPAAVATLAVGAVGVGGQDGGMVDPVHQVDAGSMAPLDPLPVGGIGVVLVENVVAALLEQGAVDIIHPGRGRQKVVGGPLAIAPE